MNKFPVEIINLILEATQEKELLPWIQDIINNSTENREKKVGAFPSYFSQLVLLRIEDYILKVTTVQILPRDPSPIQLFREANDTLFWSFSDQSFKLFSASVPKVFLFREIRGNLHWIPLSLEDPSITKDKDQSCIFNLLYNLEW